MTHFSTLAPAAGEDFLYQQIADRLAGQIKQQLLKTGDKLPSVRALSQEQGISLSTAYKAYVQLEINGLIEARPKSGYYVRYTPARPFVQQKPAEPLRYTKKRSLDEMISWFTATIPAKVSSGFPGRSRHCRWCPRRS